MENMQLILINACNHIQFNCDLCIQEPKQNDKNYTNENIVLNACCYE